MATPAYTPRRGEYRPEDGVLLSNMQQYVGMLGRRPYEVLRYYNVRGNHHVLACPISNYMKLMMGQEYSFETWENYVVLARMPDAPNLSVMLHKNVVDFIGKFDDGGYRELHSDACQTGDCGAQIEAP